MIFSRILPFCTIVICCCSKPDLASIPTFVSIQEVAFEPPAGQERLRNQLISEIWIYADSQLIGAYPVPAIVPILGDELVRLDVYAGIRENGQAASPIVYPLMNPWSMDINLNANSRLELTPTFTYGRTIRFALVEDFESGNQFRQDLDGDTLTGFEISTLHAIEGKSARSVLSTSHPLLEVASNFAYSNLPSNGAPVFLELEYASETSLAVGLKTGNGDKLYKLLLFANDLVPQKIYVNFTAEIEAAKTSDFELIFLSTYDESSGKSEQEVIIDNIKLLHFRT